MTKQNKTLKIRGYVSSFTFLLILFSLLSKSSFSSLFDSDIGHPENSQNSPSLCQIDFIKTFGFKGLSTPERYKLQMCPEIKNSCCRYSDQTMIYDNWIISGEKSDLEERFDNQRELYETILNQGERIEKIVRHVQQKLHQKSLSNCNILAESVLLYNITKVTDFLRPVMQTMYDFFESSYQGFYCAICNLSYQRFFRIESKKIVMTKDFCRRMTKSTFHFLIYFHVHMIKYINTLMRFVNHCDKHGVYSSDPVGQYYLLSIDQEIEEKLEHCREFRNREEWFEKCHFICDKFNILTVNDFFYPHSDKYRSISQKLEQKIEEFDLPVEHVEEESFSDEDNHQQTNEPRPVFKKRKQKRAGSEYHSFLKTAGQSKTDSGIGPTKIAAQKKQKTIFNTKFVIKSQSMMSKNLEYFDNEFADDRYSGIDFYEIGKYTQITTFNFRQTKTESEGEYEMEIEKRTKIVYPVLDEINAEKLRQIEAQALLEKNATQTGKKLTLPGGWSNNDQSKPGARRTLQNNRTSIVKVVFVLTMMVLFLR